MGKVLRDRSEHAGPEEAGAGETHGTAGAAPWALLRSLYLGTGALARRTGRSRDF